MSLICLETLTSMHVFPATVNDCILQTNSFGLVNRHIFRPIGRNFQPLSIISHFIYVFFRLSGKWFVLPMLFVFEDENKLSKGVICQNFISMRLESEDKLDRSWELAVSFSFTNVNVHGIRMKCIQIQSWGPVWKLFLSWNLLALARGQLNKLSSCVTLKRFCPHWLASFSQNCADSDLELCHRK